MPTCSSTREWNQRTTMGRTLVLMSLLIYLRYWLCFFLLNVADLCALLLLNPSFKCPTLSFSGFGTTTCSFCRIKTYLNTPTLGEHKSVCIFGHILLAFLITTHSMARLVIVSASCGSSAAASPAPCQTPKLSPSWLPRWEVIQAFSYYFLAFIDLKSGFLRKCINCNCANYFLK